MPSVITTVATFTALLAAALGPVASTDAAGQLRGAAAAAGTLQALPDALPEAASEADEAHSGRTLLKAPNRSSRRQRGSSNASPSKPKSKKKSPPKKKSKKKSPPKKKSKKKSPPKKKSSPKRKPSTNNRQAFSTTITAESRSSVSVGSITTYGATSRQFTGHGTHFEAMGTPYAGCGVPPHKAYDDSGKALPWVALNTNSEFENGINCGRWVEIKLGENCVGAGNSQWSVCNGGSWQSDDRTGEKMYGYVMDHCPDDNFWCKNDPYHLDLSRPYLTAKGLTGPHVWNGRKIHWNYIDDVPAPWSMGQLKFMWLKSSNWIPKGYGFFGGLIIYNLPNGISRVAQKVGSSWVDVRPLFHLRNQWILQKPSNYVSAPNGGLGQSIDIEVWDVGGNSYGQYRVDWSCGTGHCSSDADASSYKL